MTSSKCAGSIVSPKVWTPFTVTSDPYAVILLNQPIQIGVSEFQKLWNAATFRHCVDGGTNQLFEFSKANDLDLSTPNLVTGDFDSILPEVKAHYANLGAAVVETEDQNYTDFTKALMTLFGGIKSLKYPSVKHVMVVNEPSGRHDQFFANIATLSKFRCNNIPTFLVSRESMSWILCEGSHLIRIDKSYVDSKPFCGLIPLQGPTHMKSDGLRWNLSVDMECSFTESGMVSTSNEIVADTVTVNADKDILWTMKSF